MKKAFTLIELLVVIAIIAILAAILFPVFAQAKEAAKKTSALSSAKQEGTAFVLYSSDADDLFPQAVSVFPDGSTTTDLFPPYPAGYSPVLNGLWPVEYQAMTWYNSVAPYAKNQQITEVAGFRKVAFWNASANANPLKPIGSITLTMNGYLGSYSASSVASPSSLTMLYHGLGKQATFGAGFSSPTLDCPDLGPCIYNGGRPQAGSSAVNYGFWSSSADSYQTFNKSNMTVRTDTSAKTVSVAPVPGNAGGSTGAGDWRYDPYAQYTKLPTPASIWTGSQNNATFALHFMPDLAR